MQLPPNNLLQGGKYKIESVLGQGGFGITYKAIIQVEVKGPLGMIQTEIHVAIKEFFMKDLCNRDEQTCQVSVPSSGSVLQVESYRKKFWKEAQNLSKLNHPNIVKVLDVFNENNTSYYVMEYINGGSLQQYVKQQGAIPEETALTYIRQLASALDYMHQNHVCHLDLKPGNILMDDKKSQVKLIDFGLSKQYDDEGGQTSSTPVGVSEGYAPMEQYELGGVSEFSPATDIYSLGATLFFLLSGMKPPKASLVLNEGLPKLPATISTATRHTIETAMNPRRKDRPQVINSFLALLDESNTEVKTIIVNTKNDDTLIKNPPQKQETRRKKGLLIYITILLFIALCGIGIGLYFKNTIYPIAFIEFEKEDNTPDGIYSFSIQNQSSTTVNLDNYNIKYTACPGDTTTYYLPSFLLKPNNTTKFYATGRAPEIGHVNFKINSTATLSILYKGKVIDQVTLSFPGVKRYWRNGHSWTATEKFE